MVPLSADLPATVSQPRQPAVRRSDATIATYERLAPEYDDPAHVTTRTLEHLSISAFRRTEPLVHAKAVTPVLLELGAGTGVLTREVVFSSERGRMLVTDPARSMYTRLLYEFAAIDDVTVAQLDAVDALAAYGSEADVILAGLADPFLTPDVLNTLTCRVESGTLLFATVPSRRWAQVERRSRLHVPVDHTRFRLRDGDALEAASWTYDDAEFAKLAQNTGLDPLFVGMLRAKSPIHRIAPEITWMLARAV